MGRKLGAVLLFGGSWVPILQNVAWAEAYLYTKWHLDASSRLAIIKNAPKIGGGALPPFGGGELSPQLMMMMMMMMSGFVERVINSPQTRCRSAKQVGLHL